MSGRKAKLLTFGKRGECHKILHIVPDVTESHVIMLKTGKNRQYIFTRLSSAVHSFEKKHGPDWKAEYDRRFYSRYVPDFGHHFSYKRYVFSMVSLSEMITI